MDAESLQPIEGYSGQMKILVACEFSGRVRQACRDRGHDAWSCDLLPADDNSPYHIQADARLCLDGHIPGVKAHNESWDLLIAFPPCTHLAVSGARWFNAKRAEQKEAIEFFKALACADIPRIAIENPIGIMSTHYRKPDQIIQPWQFGHGETKATCLWLKSLPTLKHTNIVAGREGRVWKEPPGPDRWKKRSITYQGIADAMAKQWGGVEHMCPYIPIWQCPACINPHNQTKGLADNE